MIIVSKILLPLTLSIAFLAGCANQQSTKPFNQPDLVGIWAMVPLGNGIANVTEYQNDGKVRLHPFNCVEESNQEVEVSSYSLAADGKSIRLNSPTRSFDLDVLAYSERAMMLGMSVGDSQLKFLYKKVEKVEPLCDLYPNAKAEAARRTAYHPSDFTPAPAIPEHVGMERYIGKWVNEKGGVEVQILRDSEGKTYLSWSDNENWQYLYNNVRWEGDVLHYQSFAYSEKQSMYRHPYHKTSTPMNLEPAAGGKLLNTYVISGKRYEQLLQRSVH